MDELDKIINSLEQEIAEKNLILKYLKTLEYKTAQMEDEYQPKNNQKLARVWNGMKNRCYNSNTDNYKNYGGRGIKVCEEWFESSSRFIKWALNHGYKDGLQLDRIDVNGDYEPSNCRWVTAKTNSRNRRNTDYLTCNGETKSIAEWCELYGIQKSGKIYKWKNRNSKEYAEMKLEELIRSGLSEIPRT